MRKVSILRTYVRKESLVWKPAVLRTNLIKQYIVLHSSRRNITLPDQMYGKIQTGISGLQSSGNNKKNKQSFQAYKKKEGK